MAINNKIPKGSVKEWIVRVKTQNPEYTLQAIGDICDVTREYVRQVLNAHGIETTKRLKPLPRCVTCNSEFSRNRAIKHTECSACVSASKRTVTTCPNCGVQQEILKSHVRRNKNTFCNNFCQFSYWGKTYGFQKSKNARSVDSEWQYYNTGKYSRYLSKKNFIFKE